jgi:ATP-dependent RNA helicase DHX36
MPFTVPVTVVVMVPVTALYQAGWGSVRSRIMTWITFSIWKDLSVQYLEGLVSNVTTPADAGHHAPVEPTRKSDPGRWWTTYLVSREAEDMAILSELEALQTNFKYSKMGEFRRKLPSWNYLDEIVRVIETNRVTVISGETGCGKSTQVPQFILDHYIREKKGSLCRVVCTQPRRISAITVAERVAQERGTRCGDRASSCGYQIRLESRFPRDCGSILYCTTGIVLKWLESNPELNHVSHLILDEIHERDLLSDFLMIVLKDVLAVNQSIKIILMSATLNAEKFSQYYNDASMIHTPGFTYPVEEFYMEHIVDWLSYQPTNHRGSHSSSSMKDISERNNFEEYLHSIATKYTPKTVETLKTMD